MNRITDLSAYELTRAISAHEVSAEEAVRAYLQQIERWDREIHAFNEIFTDHSLERAREIDRRKASGKELPPLSGLPVAVKDNLCTLYGHTTCSSRILEGFKAPYEATVISRLEQAGAVIIGKTNMDEFAMGSSTENSCNGPTRNPWDTERVPGGSSGGSAAAVSARLCAAAIGSDTGGSIRQPAALCGVVGLKPTYGRVSRYGLVAYGSSLDQIGPVTKDVTDCALLARVISGHDPMDSTSVEMKVPDYLSDLNEPLQELTIGIPEEFLSEALDREVHEKIEEAVEAFRSVGAKTVTVRLPHSRIDVDSEGELSSYAVACYYIIAMAEASSNLSRYDGVHYGFRTDQPVEDIIELYSLSRSQGFGDEVKRRIMLGTYTLSSGYYDAYYLKALKVRRLIKGDFDAAFRFCDMLLCPVSPGVAFKIGEKVSDPLKMYLEDIYTLSLNLAGIPGLALPCGISDSGLPVGMQLVGPVFSEELLLRAGRMFESKTGITRLVPRTDNPNEEGQRE
jgi:aspartyl-tRNA(Asn)/glutamyl-tRNA(Gln) amidotransferase subunit A